MSREYQNIDDLFRSELANLDAEVPAGIKAGIDSKLKFKRSKPALLWFGLPLVALLITGAILVPYGMEEEDLHGNEMNVSEKKHSGDISTNQTQNEEDHLFANSDLDETDSEAENASWEEQVTSSNSNTTQPTANSTPKLTEKFSKKTNAINNASKAIVPSSVQTEQKKPVKVKSDEKNSETVASSTNNSFSTVNKKSESVNQTNTQTEPTTSKNIEKINNSENATTNSGVSTSTTFQNEEENLTQIAQPNDSDLSKATSEEEETSTDESLEAKNGESKQQNPNSEVREGTNSTAAEVAANSDDEKEDVDETNESNSLDDLDNGITLEPKEVYNPWFITAEGGVNISRSFYSANNMNEQDLYNSSLTDQIGQEFSIMANYRFKKGLILGSGLSYSRFSENFHFVEEYWDKDSSIVNEIIWEDTVAIDTIETVVYDSTFISNFNEQGVNKASYLSIPLNLGTQIIWNKFRFDLYASLRYNILVSASGKYHVDGTFPGVSGNFLSFTQKSGSIYRAGYFDMTFGGNVHYNLYKNLFLTASVRYKPVFGDTYQLDYVKRKFHYTHLGLGISLKL